MFSITNCFFIVFNHLEQRYYGDKYGKLNTDNQIQLWVIIEQIMYRFETNNY